MKDLMNAHQAARLRRILVLLQGGSKRQAEGQVKKSTGRMPWHWEPMKDVTSCEKLRGGANIR